MAPDRLQQNLFLRPLLFLLMPIYSLVMWLRNTAFDLGLKKTKSVQVPVISVGNISVGGTGKTPVVEWLCEALKNMGLHPAIVSRGYHSIDGEKNDEALQSAFPVFCNADRILAAREAKNAGHNVIVLDDGFQHRALQRNWNIVLLDARRPFGICNWPALLPFGSLRENLTALKRADYLLFTRSDQAQQDQLYKLENIAKHFELPFSYCQHSPQLLRQLSNSETPLDTLSQRSVFAFCGIATPEAFYQSLQEQGAQICEYESFPDHYHYTIQDLIRLTNKAEQLKAIMICTEKDFVKIKALTDALPQRTQEILYAFIIKAHVDNEEECLKLLPSLGQSTH